MQKNLTKKADIKKRQALKRDILKNIDLYLLMIIPSVLLLVFSYYPMLGLQIAFKKYNVSGGIWGSPWVGFDQFARLFSTAKFTQAFFNTIKLSVYQILVEPAVTLIFALLLNAVYSKAFKKTVQMISYMPHFVSTVVMVSILTQMLSTKVGFYGRICDLLGVVPVDLWAKPEAFPHMFVWSLIWQNIGWNAIIYVAALSNVNPDLYEASSIDGASRFKQLLCIDIPEVMPTFVVLFILKAGSMMAIGYEQVLLMQNPLNLSTSEIISTYSYKVGLENTVPDYSFGTAISLFNSVINLVILLAVNKISKSACDVSLW